MRAVATFLLLALVAALPAPAQEAPGTQLVSSLEKRYRTAAEAAERVTVAVLVDREEDPAEKKNEAPTPPRALPFPLPQHPTITGGVFANRPLGRPTSGTIIGASGLILTTAFNVRGGIIRSIRVRLPDGREFDAEVVGFNELYDVALLKVDAENLPTLKGANLDLLKPGLLVTSAGRAPDGRGLTLNPGIFSAPGRDGGRTIQVDCRLNYGNVGGPLLDRHGNLVGMTCKVRDRDAASIGQNSGVAFVIAWDKIQEILPHLKDGMQVEVAKGAFLGISGTDWDDGDGVEIMQILGSTAAEAAGLQPGDILIEFDGRKVKGMEQLRDMILRHKVGDEVNLKILRNGEEKGFKVKLGQRAG